MIKNGLMLSLVLLLLPGVIATQQFTVDLATAYTDPMPVEPGSSFVLAVQATNKGNEKLGMFYLDIYPSSPFAVVESPRKTINGLNGYGTKIVEYKMFVDSSAVSAVYTIPIDVVYGSAGSVRKNVQVRVQGVPHFEILSVRSNEINPGDRENINVEIQNTGTGVAKRMTAKFVSSSPYIKPIFSGGSVYINEFKPGEKQWIKFDILADQAAEFGVYTATITLEYADEAGNSHKDSYDIGILISGQPDLNVVKSQADMKNKKVTVEVINSGTGRAVAIRGELWVDGKMIDTDYITQIKMDKKADFKFDLPEKASSRVLKIYYKGPDNKEFQKETDVSWVLPPRNYMVFGLVALALGALIIWKKPWKKIGALRKKK